MPIYFLHLTEEQQVIADTEGIQLPDVAAVEQAAIRSARDLIAEAVRMGDRNYKGRLDAKNEHGTQVLTLRFDCTVQIDVVRAMNHS
jgi:hypothetical protein